jgi:hypothetical protein
MDDSKHRSVEDVEVATLNGAVQSFAFPISFTEVEFLVRVWITYSSSQFPKLPPGRSYEITLTHLILVQ